MMTPVSRVGRHSHAAVPQMVRLGGVVSILVNRDAVHEKSAKIAVQDTLPGTFDNPQEELRDVLPSGSQPIDDDHLVIITGIVSKELDLEKQRLFTLRLDKYNWKKAAKWCGPRSGLHNVVAAICDRHVKAWITVCQMRREGCGFQFVRGASSMTRRDKRRDSLMDRPHASQDSKVSKDLRNALLGLEVHTSVISDTPEYDNRVVRRFSFQRHI